MISNSFDVCLKNLIILIHFEIHIRDNIEDKYMSHNILNIYATRHILEASFNTKNAYIIGVMGNISVFYIRWYFNSMLSNWTKSYRSDIVVV